MDTHHTVMREEFSLVNARMYGPTRNSATIQAALTAMGTDPGVLVLMEEDGGVWTLDSDVLIPATVTLSIPAGVTVTGSGNLTILGGLAAWRLTWYQGTGTVVWTDSAAPQLSATLHAGSLALGGPVAPLVTLRATGSVPWTLTLPSVPGTAQQVLTTNGAGVTSWVTVQAADATLQALADLATAPDTAPYFTATDEAALMTVTPLARQLLDDATIAAMQATLQAQPVDATLTGLAGITTGANLLPYLTGTDQWATCVLSPYARTLFDDPDAPAMRGTLQLGALSTLGTVTTPYITDGAVTLPKLADIPDARLLGRASGNAGPVQTLSVGAGLQLTGGMLQLAGGAIVGTGAASRIGVWSSAGTLSYADNLQLELPMGQLTYNRVLSSGLASGTLSGTWLGLDATLHAASTAQMSGLRVFNTYRPTGFNATDNDAVVALRATVTTVGTSGGTVTGLKGAYIRAEHAHSGKITQIEALRVETAVTGSGTLDYTYGIVIQNAGAIGAVNTSAMYSNIPAGSGSRFNLGLPGTAPNYLGGWLGLGITSPSYPLDVVGSTRISGGLTVGGAPLTGTMDVLATLNATDYPTEMFGIRLRMRASLASTGMAGLRLEPPTVTGAGTIPYYAGVQVLPVSGIPTIQAFYSAIAAGANQHNLYCAGTAQNFLAGWLGIGTPVPTAPLAFANLLGPKIDIYNSPPYRYGIGLQSGQMQIYAPAASMLRLGTMDADGVTFTPRFDVETSRVYTLAPMAVGWGFQANYELITNRFYAAGISYFANPAQFASGLSVSGSYAFQYNLENYGTTRLAGYTVIGPIGGVGYAIRAILVYDKDGTHGMAFHPTGSDAGSASALLFTNVAGVAVGYILTTATGTSYVNASDGRLKEGLEPLPEALATVQALRPWRFRWKADGSIGHGLVAQEVQTLVPEAVSGDETSDLPMGIDYGKLVPWLIGALQTVAQRVEHLEAEMIALRGTT